jgi:hypothetical protein
MGRILVDWESARRRRLAWRGSRLKNWGRDAALPRQTFRKISEAKFWNRDTGADPF